MRVTGKGWRELGEGGGERGRGRKEGGGIGEGGVDKLPRATNESLLE